MSKVYEYIEEITGEKLKFLTEEVLRLPRIFSLNYKWTFVEIFETKCMLLFMQTDRLITSAVIEQMNIIEKKANCPVVLVFNKLTSEQRRRLIKKRLPFIETYTQLFLPFLMFDYRKRKNKIRSEENTKRRRFTPSNQLICLYLLYLEYQEFYAKELEFECQVSAMTVNRTLNLLIDMKLIKMIGSTKDARYCLTKSRREFFNEIRHLCINPIKNTGYIERVYKHSDFVPTGEYGLSLISMMDFHGFEQYAIRAEHYRKLKPYIWTEPYAAFNEPTIELHVWSYDPQLTKRFAQRFENNFNNSIPSATDIFSLYFSFKDNEDERIQKELDLLLNHALGE